MWKLPRIEHADPSKPWPSERFAHSFLKLPKTDCAILFGGVTLPYYRSKQLIASQTFEISPVNDVFYLYDNSVKLWSVPETCNLPCVRAWHAATGCTKSDGSSFILISGGCTKDGEEWKALSELYMMTRHHNIFDFNCEIIQLESEVFISDHSITTVKDQLVVVGGMICIEQFANPQPSSEVYIYSLITKNLNYKVALPQQYQTAGSHLTVLPDNSLLLSGGFGKKFTVLTFKPMDPEVCFHWDKEYLPYCKVQESREVTPTWIICEMPHCKTWLHLLCIGEEWPEKAPWYCKPCSEGKRPSKHWK